MAKTYRQLFGQIVDFGNLHAAYLKARRGKRYTADILRFSANLEQELLALRAELSSGAYCTGHYKVWNSFIEFMPVY